MEAPGSRPLAFEAGNQLALELRTWPAEQVVKCLVHYHPDDPDVLRERQLERLCDLQAASIGTGHEFLIEVIPPRELPRDQATLARALAQIYAAGVRPDWWKLPPCESDDEWQAVAAAIRHGDLHCRGVLLLGLEASEADLQRSFRVAAPHAVCRGFAVGRSIFAEAAERWFSGESSDAQVVLDVAQRYARLIARWDEARAGFVQAANAAR